MKKFWSYIENDKYGVGCTGQTVYVCDQNGEELASFKGLRYAYVSAFSPLGDIFVVKSKEGILAVYSLESLSLIKKIRYSKLDAQDDGFCFSPDGKYFINLERQGEVLNSAISVYDTSDFSKISQVLLGEHMMVSHIEAINGEYYVLGFLRGDDRVITNGFVAKFTDNEIKDILTISESEHLFYICYLDLKMAGFAEEAYASYFFDMELDKLKRADHTLEKLWKYYSDNNKS